MMRTARAVAATAALVVLLGACGDDESHGGLRSDGGDRGKDRPTTAELAKAIRSPDTPIGIGMVMLDDELFDCIAQELYDSEATDKALRAAIDRTYEPAKSDAEASDTLAIELNRPYEIANDAIVVCDRKRAEGQD